MSVSGCIEDDNDYPVVTGTSWQWSNDDGSQKQRLIFADKTVTHIVVENSDTIMYSCSFNGDSSFGKHFYTWDNYGALLCYRVYSYGYNHLMMTIEFLPGRNELFVGKNVLYFTKE